MRLLVLQHCPVTPIGLVGERAVERGADLVTLFPHDGDQVPETMAGFGGLIVLGGPMHAGDDARYPAFAPMLSLIRECRAANVPVLGLCLGAQLIARVRATGLSLWCLGGRLPDGSPDIGRPSRPFVSGARSRTACHADA